MTWDDLKLNLLSEAIGILVTVVLVDRIIELREGRRWKPARQVFLAHIAFLELRLSVILRDWLLSLTTDWEATPVGWEHVWDPAAKRARDREVLNAMEFFGQGSPRARVRKVWADNLNRAMSSLFLPRPLSASGKWERFSQESRAIRDELSEVVSNFSTFLDPSLALMIVQITRSLGVIVTTEERWNTYFESRDGDRRGARKAGFAVHLEFERILAMALTNLISQTALLHWYVKRHRRSLSAEALHNPHIVEW